MAGPLIGQGHLAWFLWPHVAALLACAHLLNARLFRIAAAGGTLLTALLTIAYVPFSATAANLILALLGITAAPVVIYLVVLLKGGARPVMLAAIGLGLGNFAEMGLELLPLTIDAKLALLAGALPGVLLVSTPHTGLTDGPTPGLFRYLPFILVFQVVSGMMYGQLYPAYLQVASAPTVELLFYAFAALGAARLVGRDRELALLLGVAFAMLAFVLLHLVPSPAGPQAALFGMMIAAGIMDLFLLAHVLSFPNQLRAAGFGVGALVGGIASGEWLISNLGASSQNASMVALVVLNLAVITLILRRDRNQVAAGGEPAMPESPPPITLPDSIELRLSGQERQVLTTVLKSQTYREVAEALAISESSVKTYMQRIYRKTGVFNQRQLRQLVESSAQDKSDAPGIGDRS